MPDDLKTILDPSALIASAPVGIFLTDAEGICLLVNNAWCSMTGRAERELLGASWLNLVHPEDRVRVSDSWGNAINSKNPWEDEYRYVNRDGQLLWIAGRAAHVRNDDGQMVGYACAALDITERKAAEQRAVQQSRHDPLTLLPNRAYFLNHLAQALADDTQKHLAILFLDLDRFKAINDTYGHAVGDALLKKVAQRLLFCAADLPGELSNSAFVARMSGDEFTMLLPNMSIEQTRQVASRLLRVLAEPYRIDGHEIVAQASVGIAQSLSTDTTAEEIIRSADSAMYQAKAQGQGRVEIFMPQDRRKNIRMAITPGDLKKAIENNELTLHYQPVIRTNTLQINYLEALVRWHRRGVGDIPAWRLIAIAEEADLIDPLGRWVLGTALRQLQCWQKTYPNMAVHLNVSGHQLLNGQQFVSMIHDSLDEQGIAPHALGLEFTESTIVGNTSLEFTEQLRALGVRMYLDDFGWGRLGLATMYRLPLDGMNLDSHLIYGAENQARQAAVVRSIVHLARDLSVDLVAKGVETQEQLQFLRAIGCPGAQGYAIARPMSAPETSKYLVEYYHRIHAITTEAA